MFYVVLVLSVSVETHSCFHWYKKCKNPPRNMGVMVQNKVARFLWLMVYMKWPNWQTTKSMRIYTVFLRYHVHIFGLCKQNVHYRIWFSHF